MFRMTIPTFHVMGKEGSSADGEGFVQRLWAEANAHFPEIAPLVRKNRLGVPAGIWGVMTDFSRSFAPWEDDFSRGLYLAGAECAADAVPPEGWVKWTIPCFDYACFPCADSDTFRKGLDYLKEHGLTLAGAVQDFTDPTEGKSYMCFPVRRL